MQDITEEEKYWLWLASVEGIGPVRFYHVLNTFTDIKSAWENCTEITRCVKGINEKMGAKLCERANDAFIERFLKFLSHKNINVLTRLNQDYPKRLRRSKIRRRYFTIKGRCLILTICPAR